MANKIADEVYARQIAKYPEAWAELKAAVKTIKITTQRDKYASVCEDLENSGLQNPEDYVRAVSDNSHGVKLDTIIYTDKLSRYTIILLFLGKRGSSELNTFKQEPGTAQIGARYIATRLITEGIKPRTLVERATEKAWIADGSA
jgi:hypothetical protein